MIQEVELGDALELLVDNRGKNPPFEDSGIPLLSGKSLTDQGIDMSAVRFVSEEIYRRWMPHPIRKGDLVMTSEAPLGRVALVRTDSPVALGQRLFGMRGRVGVLDTRFLFYALRTSRVRADLDSRATGTTVLGIRQPELRKLRIPAPPYDQQLAIAEVLGALDDKLSANSNIVAFTKELLAAKVSSLRVGEAPHTGEAIPLPEFVELNPRTTGSLNGTQTTYLEMKNCPSETMTISQWSSRAPQGGARFQNGDTLLARITPCLENGKAGYVDFLQPGEIGVGSTEFIVMRPRAGMPTTLPYFLATDARFRDFAIRHMVGTTGRQRLSATELSNYELLRPDDSALAALSALEGALMPRLKAAVDESRVLSATRDELLPLLMSGKIRVREAEKVVEGVV